jgi:hypothetical protein
MLQYFFVRKRVDLRFVSVPRFNMTMDLLLFEISVTVERTVCFRIADFPVIRVILDPFAFGRRQALCPVALVALVAISVREGFSEVVKVNSEFLFKVVADTASCRTARRAAPWLAALVVMV